MEIMSRWKYATNRNPKKKNRIDSPLNRLQCQRDADSRKHAADNRQHTNNLIAKEIKNVLQIFRAVVHDQEAGNHRKQEQQSLRQ